MKLQYKIEFGFGTGTDINGNQLSAETVANWMPFIEERAAHQFGAYTLMDCKGGWTNRAGGMVQETGKILFTIQPIVNHSKVAYLASYIRGALNQESVAVTISEVRFECLDAIGSKCPPDSSFAAPAGSATTLRAEVERAEERLRNDPCTQSRRVLSEASAAWRRAIWDDNHTNQSND